MHRCWLVSFQNSICVKVNVDEFASGTDIFPNRFRDQVLQRHLEVAHLLDDINNVHFLCKGFFGHNDGTILA